MSWVSLRDTCLTEQGEEAVHSVAPVHFVWFKLEALEEEEGPSPSLCYPSVEEGEQEDPLRPSSPHDVNQGLFTPV